MDSWTHWNWHYNGFHWNLMDSVNSMVYLVIPGIWLYLAYGILGTLGNPEHQGISEPPKVSVSR